MQLPSIRIAFRKTTLALVTTILLTAGAVHAQTGVLTQDIKQEAEAHAQTLKQISQYIKQGQQYETQIQQYEQMLTKVENLGSNFQLMPATMEHIDPDPLVQANCGNSSGSIASNLLNQITSLLNQSIAESQQRICSQIINTQVHKYNATVDVLGVLSANTSSLQKLNDLTSNFTNAGESSSASTQAAGYSNEMAARMNQWEGTVKADDAIINSLQDMQSTLARNAMNAKPSMTGQAVQAAVLTTAFTYHPSL